MAASKARKDSVMTLPRKPITPASPRRNGLMPRSATRPHTAPSDLVQVLSAVRAAAPARRGLAPVLAAAQPVAQLAEAFAPAAKLARTLSDSPAAQLARTLSASPAVQLARTLSASPAMQSNGLRPRLVPPMPSLFDQRPCDRQQTEIRLISVSGTREDWAKLDDGHMVGLSEC